jgi:hypothetical protein
MDFLYFLGRFHVLLLHLPIGILLLAVVLEVASRRERFNHLSPAVGAVWAFGAISAIVTAMLGYLHASEGGFVGDAVNAHRIAGTVLALVATAIWLLRRQAIYQRAWLAWSLAVVGLLFVTGHYGGNLTHGDTYLTQYAPAPLRWLMGLPEPRVARPKPKDVPSAVVWLDVVAPALDQRCSTCHNDSKRKGGLSVASYETLMRGGEHGPVIVAGDAKASDLVRRITLPADDKDFMPHDGKTPLSAEQTRAIAWWVSAGASPTAAIAALKPPAEVLANLETALGFRPQGALAQTKLAASAPPAVPAADVPPPDARVLDALERDGFSVRAITVDSPLVQVDYTANRSLDDAHLAELAKIGRQIYSLNLRNAGVTDEHLQTMSQFDHMVKLRLELNPITDAGLARLAGLKKLEYLNLYGTKVSNAGLASLAALGSLREVFLWQTAVTPAAISEFRRAHANIRVNDGFDPRTFPEGPKSIPVVN